MKEKKELRTKTYRFRCTETEHLHIHSVCVELNMSLIDLLLKAYKDEFKRIKINKDVKVHSRIKSIKPTTALKS